MCRVWTQRRRWRLCRAVTCSAARRALSACRRVRCAARPSPRGSACFCNPLTPLPLPTPSPMPLPVRCPLVLRLPSAHHPRASSSCLSSSVRFFMFVFVAVPRAGFYHWLLPPSHSDAVCIFAQITLAYAEAQTRSERRYRARLHGRRCGRQHVRTQPRERVPARVCSLTLGV